MMGHRHITTTERYLHYAPDPDAAAKLSRLWQNDSTTSNVVSISTPRRSPSVGSPWGALADSEPGE